MYILCVSIYAVICSLFSFYKLFIFKKFIFILYIIYIYVSEIYLEEQTSYVPQADSNLLPDLHVQCAGIKGAQGPYPEQNSSSLWHEE